MILRVLLVICFFITLGPAVARGSDLAAAPLRLALEISGDPPDEVCRRIEPPARTQSVSVPLHRTFHDDFDEHPLNGKWVPHYAGGAAWPDSRYWGGDGSDFKRKTAYNGEQQIYVDPRYGGRSTTPLGLDPFTVHDGVLSIIARRTPPELREVLFNNEYISGVLTTQGWFSQKYGYFEIRSRIPIGDAVWPAFWMLADDGGWPPEIDIVEGRGQQRDVVAMTTHWRIRATGMIKSCGFDFQVAGASSSFHDYGALWQSDRITYYIDRKPVADIKTPVGFNDPMYMIVNLAMGAKYFKGVGFVDADSPEVVAFEIDRISAYQIDSVGDVASPRSP